MQCEDNEGLRNCLDYIHLCTDLPLQKIAKAVMHRYDELYPDYEVVYLALSKNDAAERKRSIQAMVALLEYEKKDSLG